MNLPPSWLIRQGDCDNRVEEFAKKYADRAVEFDGNIASMVNHGSYKTIWDILVNAGKPALTLSSLVSASSPASMRREN